MTDTLLAQADFRNNLLRIMPQSSFTLLKPFLEPVAMPLRMKLAEAGRSTSWMYFPEAGIASIISQTSRAWQEIGIFGRDGAGSAAGLLSPNVAPYTIIMQIEGRGHRIKSEALIAATEQCGVLRSMLARFNYAFGIQVAETAVANVQCNITERLARWILMIDDRIDQSTINITHEFLAGMLGVGRTGVTLALHELEKAGLISTSRKRIDLLDRPALTRLTLGYYGFAEKEYSRLFQAPATLSSQKTIETRLAF